MELSVSRTPGTAGVPQSAGIGLEGFRASPIMFSFPDILFEPRDAISALISRLESGGADVVLGLFPTPNPERSDMVAIDSAGLVRDIEIKPGRTELDLTWIMAAWTPRFSEYLRDALAEPERLRRQAINPDDQQMGQVFRQAIADGIPIASVSFEGGRSLDIGTPDDLDAAADWLA